MDILAEMSSLGLLGTGLSQHARLFTLTSAQQRGLPESLLAEQFTGREAVNELFAFDIDALSTSADLDLAEFIGEELTIALLQPDGSRRAWHGMCTRIDWQGADGGVARYRLRLEPALSMLALRRDSYIFQDKNAQEIITELLSDYPGIRFDFDITQQLAQRPITTQYRESDLEFFQRILASEGLNWRFEHDQAGEEDDTQGDGHSRHRLVIFDSQASAPATPNGDILRFHGVRATDTDDAIDQFRARRQVQANAVSISSWDPEQLLAPSAEQQSSLDAGELPTLAVYDGSGERIASDSEVADPHSALMLQALELENKTFEGAGAVRRLAAGHAFTLTQHEREGDDASFKVLWVRHQARNNFGSQIKAAERSGVQAGTYRNQFACVRDSVPIVPAATAAPHASTALGPQTALIVGLADAVATTERDHRVKVQFAWQRGQNPNAGGMNHNLDEKGSAPGDETAGTWVRVAEALAGPNWGSHFTPRIGTEVLVDFIEGDMDRPVVVAQLYTGSDLPPFSAGVDSAANHAGSLSGIHSHNFDGGGFNQWQLDDTSGQVRTRLATSTAATQLNLGYLIAQQPSSAQRGSYRGSGFELRTDAWGVVRGGEGVLLSTTARAQQGSGVTSTQMDVTEAVDLLKGAQDLATRLGDAAREQQALASADAAAAHNAFVEQIDAEAKGKFSGAVNGQEAVKAKAGARETDPDAPVEKFASPVVMLDSAAGINWATPASTALFAGEHLQWTTQSDLHMTAAHTLSAASANAASLFTHAGGIQAIAANGPVSLEAHTDLLEILADQSITVISVNDTIEIKAKEKIVLQAGQSSITLDGGDITFACPGNFTVKGSQHPFEGGASNAALLPGLATSLISKPITEVVKPGPHAVEVLAFSAEGEALKDAVVQYFDPVAGAKFAERTIGGAGTSSEVLADHNQPYKALVGYEGWTAQFEEVGDDEDDDEPDFDPGELDEDRDIEHL
ncbi:type VI secretion system tip protein VgrG [Massilia sp. PAMC28688]|uniref:type VI secretion system Vgr family protein n=1 Tax=Massilia sp. PAMC28688 TaxID=2861283 RepID=UPI001C636376|nr:type VI secretion system tip protein TssI/VgrG [Massilia sp. PAMC28688]QYF95750.1 type VI secretion system tip protein VgrG [Massilia sp. PAMC28688]